MSVLPGKGVHLVLNQAVLDFINSSLDEIELVYTDGDHDSNPGMTIDALLESDMATWTEVNDNFGRKVYRSMAYKTGELRLTVILTQQDELRMDIREWYDPNAAR